MVKAAGGGMLGVEVAALLLYSAAPSSAGGGVFRLLLFDLELVVSGGVA